MQGFVHIFKLQSEAEVPNNIDEILKSYKSKAIFSHIESTEEIISVYFTNQFDSYPYQYDFNGLFTPVGVFTRNIHDIFNNITSENKESKTNYVKNLEGQFALGYSDFSKKELNFFTHIARIETLYSFLNDKMIIVGTDPMIMSVIAGQGKAEFDVHNMYSFIQNGYYADDKTPFKNIYALPANSYIKVNVDGIKISAIDDIQSNFLNVKYNKSDYDQLTDLFLNSFNTQNKDQEFKLALTGGKDSRLIFAAMNSNDFNFTTFTNGFSDSPDVVIAKKISELFNVSHVTSSPKISEENTINVNIYKKLKGVMLSTSGLVYGYENVSLPGKFKGNKSFDGVGAELVKGGFASFINSDDNSDKKLLVKSFNKNHQHFIRKESNPFENFLSKFVDTNIGLHKLQILYSLLYRSGRLTSAAKNSSNYSRQSHSPFLDNRFLREALKIDYDEIRNEEIHYQILNRLDDRLINVPFGKDRWRVEKEKPLKPSDYYKWLSREPYYPTTILGNYNWRRVQNNDSVVVNEFKQILLSNKNHMIYDIVDYISIQRMFNHPITAQNMRFIWSLASIIIFVNELEKISNQNFNNNISISLPSTTITEYKNKKKLVDITGDFVALNDSVNYDKYQKDIEIIDFDKNRILKLYDGIFAKPPKEINLNNIRKIRLKLNLNLMKSKKIPKIKLQILFYNDNKRNKTLFVPYNYKNHCYEFEFNQDLTADVDSFRLLINLNDAEINDAFKINYAFYEVTY